MSLFKRFFVGAGYNFLGSVIQRMLLAVAAILYARLLGVHEYGIYVNVLAFVNLLTMICLFGVNSAFSAIIPQTMAKEPRRVPVLIVAGLGIVLAFLLVACGAVAAIVGPVAATVYKGQIPEAVFLLGLPLMSAMTINTAILSILYGLQEFRTYSRHVVVLGLAVVVCSVAGVLSAGLPGLLLGAAVGYASSGVWTFVVIGRRWDIRLPEMREMFGSAAGEILRFSLPTFLSGLFVTPAYWIGNILLVNSWGMSASGLFGVANSLSQLVMFIPVTVSAPLIPMLSEVSGSADGSRFSEFVGRNLRMVWCLSLPVTVLFGSSAGIVIGILYGAPYASSTAPFVVLACMNTLVAVAGIPGYVLMAKRKMWDGLLANAAWFAFFLVAAVLLIPSRGYTGFALALFSSYVVYMGVVVAVLKRHVVVEVVTRRTVAAAVITVAAFACAVEAGVHGTMSLATAAVTMMCTSLVIVAEWFLVLSGEDRLLLRRTVENYLHGRKNLEETVAKDERG